MFRRIASELSLPRAAPAPRRAGASGSVPVLPPVALTLALSALFHWWLWPYYTTDMGAYLLPWFDHIRTDGPLGAFAEPFSNYTPPYLYLLALVSPLAEWFAPQDVIKLLSVAGTGALACALHALLRRLNVAQPHRAAALVFLLPSVVLNAGLMAQCDAFYAAAIVMALAMALDRRHAAMLVWCGIALAFKAQAVLIAPFFLGLLIQRRVPLRLWPVMPLAAALPMLPAWLAGWPAGDLGTIYLRQADTFSDLARNAPNIWSVADATGLAALLPLTGLAMAAALGAGAALAARLSIVSLSGPALVRMALVAPLLMAELLPHMHERYFFLADIMALAWALATGTRPAIWTACLVQAGSTLAILGYFGAGSGPVVAGAGAMLAATWIAAQSLWRVAANDNPSMKRADRDSWLPESLHYGTGNRDSDPGNWGVS